MNATNLVSGVYFAAPVVACARGAWGTRTHSAYGTIIVGGESLDWSAFRHFDRDAKPGERTTVDVLIQRNGRELTAAKWQAARDAIRYAFTAAVRKLADATLDATAAPSDELVQREAADDMGFGVEAVTASPVEIGTHETTDAAPVALKLSGFPSVATVAATNARLAAEDAAARIAFVVYVGSDGVPALCEGGVYSDAPQGEYVGNTVAEAARVAAGHNAASLNCTAYKVYDNADGVYVDSEVASSLEDWQLAILEGQGLRLTSLGNVREARARLKESAGFIDLTPTWAAIVPALLAAVECGTTKGREIARGELIRMAALADQRNDYAAKLADIRTELRACDAQQARYRHTKGSASHEAIGDRDAFRAAVRGVLA